MNQMSQTPTATLDAKGLSCPMPVVKARLEIDKLSAGDVLKVLATDPGSVADFKNFAQMTGNELLESSEDDGVYTYLLRKSS
jgi:tRNA 2-thiouridine synthesizing protein A